MSLALSITGTPPITATYQIQNTPSITATPPIPCYIHDTTPITATCQIQGPPIKQQA